MRSRALALILGVAVLSLSLPGEAQVQRRLNPMIALHEKGLPVFGITHPAIVPGRGRGGAAVVSEGAPAHPSLRPAAVVDRCRARDMAYALADFDYNSYSPANADTVPRLHGRDARGRRIDELARVHLEVPIVHTDPAAATARIVEQLNAGHAGDHDAGSRGRRRGAHRARRHALQVKGRHAARRGRRVGGGVLGMERTVSREGGAVAAQQERRAGAVGNCREQGRALPTCARSRRSRD